ncbi:unnamed protein product [Somion occarium]|uniref:F-box domain-containing protein n=1 Tax=Somion occarium TaxID=3059160 RepID=A0ABP1DKQ3_9APHY
MSSLASPVFPPELSDYTIDFLYDDTTSLRACALTCKTWLPASRYHIFNAVKLNDAQDLDNLSSLVSSNSAPGIVPYIHTLSISKPSPTSGLSHPTSRSVTQWEAFVPSALSLRLPLLDTLHIQSFLSFWQPSSFSISSYGLFSSVRSLHLANSSLRSFQELRSLLGRLPKVDELWLDNVTFGIEQMFVGQSLEMDDEGRMHSPFTSLTPLASGTSTPRGLSGTSPVYDLVSLTSLRVDANPKPMAILLGWLLLTPSIQTLRNVTFAALEAHDFDAVNTFLGVVGGSLERLSIGLKEGTDFVDLPLAFIRNLTLNALTFTSLSPTSSSSNAWIIPFFTRFAADAVNPIPLQSVTFEFSSDAAIKPASELAMPLDLPGLCKVLKATPYISRIAFHGIKSHQCGSAWKDVRRELYGWSGQVLFK